MPEGKNITDKILDVFINEGIIEDKNEVNSDTLIREDLNLDSLSLIRLIMSLNTTFGIEIKSVEIIPENFATMGNLEKFIRGRLI